MDEQHAMLSGVDSLLHFAPEEILRGRLRQRHRGYATADLFVTNVDYQCNIEATGLAPRSFDAVFASHVLEHVDDRKALTELHRILKPGGKLIAMVPIVEGWEETYENPSVATAAERVLHFGQDDHVRYYGRDFTSRLIAAGFRVTALAGTPQDCIAYGLQRGEKVFVGTKAP
jgi:SAM-dependent methyltransferase